MALRLSQSYLQMNLIFFYTTDRHTHQQLINDISSWTKSMKLKFKPIKCKLFSIINGKPTPMIFTLDNIDMETIQSNPHKFLGPQITFPGKQSEICNHVSNHILTRLERIDSLQVRGEYRARIYKNYLLPPCRFILTVHELTNANIDKLRPKAQSFSSHQ